MAFRGQLMKRITNIFSNLVYLIICLLLLGASSLPPADKTEQVRFYTRDKEFDYVSWTLDALWLKLSQFSLGTSHYLAPTSRHDLVINYLDLVGEISQLNHQITVQFSDPKISDPTGSSASLRQELEQKLSRLHQLAPVVEGILQGQVASIASDQELTLGGQPVPPVLYHVTDLPLALIVSPREVIRQDENISLLPGMNASEMDVLEKQVETDLKRSALVVALGGIGIYPTMVESSSDLNWLAEVISHEWTHNFLTLRPLGISIENSPELRTMNETTASLVGRELGRALIKRFYPERVPPPPPENPKPPSPEEPPKFNFRAEMHETRVTTDQLLAEGKVDEAEQYMESRRQFFWDNGYLIRKLNQAYFAFYGAYNDVSEGGGATGEAGNDPIGPAVVALRKKSASLADFLNRISWMTSFEQLKKAVQ
jgi:hypothetical protein